MSAAGDAPPVLGRDPGLRATNERHAFTFRFDVGADVARFVDARGSIPASFADSVKHDSGAARVPPYDRLP